MVLELKQLPDDTESLKQIITSQQHQIDHLQEMVRLLQNEIFGRKSEARALVNPNQLQLFTPPAEPEPVEPDETIDIKGHARKKRGRKPLPADLPRVEVVHDIPDEQKQCACGAQKSRIGEETSERLDIIPASIQVIRDVRPKYACRHCEGVDGERKSWSLGELLPAAFGPKDLPR